MNEVGGADGQVGEIDPYSRALLTAIVEALPEWVSRVMTARAASLPELDFSTFEGQVAEVAREVIVEVRDSLTRLFALDVEEQRLNPLHVLRQRAEIVTTALARLGASPTSRDEFDSVSMPDDIYGIGPMTWRDLGDNVHDAGITWGAWKAAVIISRHKSDSSAQS